MTKVTIQGHRFVTYKYCVSYNRKNDAGNLVKLHNKVHCVKHNEKVCQAQNLSNHDQGYG